MPRTSKEARNAGEVVRLVRKEAPTRPEPPPELSKDEALEWTEIVGSMPVDWFTRECHPMLIQLCRMIVQLRAVNAQMKSRGGQIKSYDDKVMLKLARLQDMYTRTMSALATKMRLSQQSKYNYAQAHALTSKHNTPKKLWEVGGKD
jgi:hypothetical protein